MNWVALFALAVATVAGALALVAVRLQRWLEAGITSGALLICLLLAALADTPDVPIWLALLAAWMVVVLAGVAAWSIVRHVEKRRTGEDTR